MNKLVFTTVIAAGVVSGLLSEANAITPATGLVTTYPLSWSFDCTQYGNQASTACMDYYRSNYGQMNNLNNTTCYMAAVNACKNYTSGAEAFCAAIVRAKGNTTNVGTYTQPVPDISSSCYYPTGMTGQ
jgi:hypothetical protein